jgi:hypothetical protein
MRLNDMILFMIHKFNIISEKEQSKNK